MSKFIPLHVHSHYSLLDGLAKIDQILDKAKEYGIPAVALTDHGVMYGAIEFYQKSLKLGIKPIIGCEMYIAPRKMTDKQPKIDARPHHLVLLVKNMEGYKNLIKLVSESHLEGFYYKPRIDKNLLKKYHNGLIALTACLNGEIPKLISSNKLLDAKKAAQFYVDLFGKDDFYLELQHHPQLPEQKKVNEGLKNLAREMDLKLVATNDTHYLNKEDNHAHEILLLVQTGKDIDDKSRLSMLNVDLSFKKPQEMEENFSDSPEAIKNTQEIADKCNLKLDLYKTILPEFPLPKGENSMGYLKKLAQKGFQEKYGQNPQVRQKFDYEISIIQKTGFADYFLIVADLINWAKNQGIVVGPGRGSAAGSIVSYCLNITDIEPTRYGLLFERFLNPERISMPDIDIDFADDRRDEVIDYIKNKYGEKHVAQIITFGTMAARGSIRDTARALGMSYQDGDRIAKLIPFGDSIDEALEEVTELEQIYKTDPEMKKLIDMAKKLEGVARHASTHACGIVIAKEPLVEYLPLQQAQKGQTSITTQYPMFDIEAIGLLKMDLLGLANLTVIRNTTRIIRKIKKQNIDINKIPLDDKKTYTLFSRAQTTGIFQFESDGMKRYLKALKPSSFDDLIAMVALYRPGPMQFIDSFIARKHGKEQISYVHPKMKPALKDTYGVIVYQEQIMQLSKDLAGFTGGQADTLRKAIGKKIAKLMAKMKNQFIEGCLKNKINKETAQKIWKSWEAFAQYCFNKSHAACYAMIAYETAYLKALFPSAFMAALLTSDFGNLDRVAIEIEECEKLGLVVSPPDVNLSFVEFGVVPENDHILFGLSAIKHVGFGVAEKIVEERNKHEQYKSLEDFILRLGPEINNKKTIEALAKSGALDSLCERNKVLANLELILKFSQSNNKQAKNQGSLFGEAGNVKLVELKLSNTDPASKKQRLAWEKELLGIYISEHPLDDVRDELKRKTQPISLLENLADRQKITLGGIITSVQKIITKSKEPMIFARLEDLSGSVEIVVFPKVLKKDPLIWRTDNIVVVKGARNSKDNELKLMADEAKNLSEAPILDGPRNVKILKKIVNIKIPQKTPKEILTDVKKILVENKGEEQVIIWICQNGNYKKLTPQLRVKISVDLKNSMAKIIGEENIKITNE